MDGAAGGGADVAAGFGAGTAALGAALAGSVGASALGLEVSVAGTLVVDGFGAETALGGVSSIGSGEPAGCPVQATWSESWKERASAVLSMERGYRSLLARGVVKD